MERRAGFGLIYAADFDLPGPPIHSQAGGAVLSVRLVTPDVVQAAWSGTSTRAWHATLDGLPFFVERGRESDHLCKYGDAAQFWLSRDRTRLLCAPLEPSALPWRRVLLDSVLLTVALLAGREALHAAAVELANGVVAVAAPTGAGKSSLAAALLGRGATFVADDVLTLEREPDAIVAHSAPAVMSVPADRTGGGVDGEVIGRIGDELWIAPRRVSHAARRVAAVILLARAPGLTLQLTPLQSTPLSLLGHSLYFEHGAKRSRARFELFADLAWQAPTYVLEAPTSAPPSALASVVITELGTRGASVTDLARAMA